MNILNMRKVALCGRANSGKNTTATLIAKSLEDCGQYMTLAFADPIKEMLLTMFPWTDRECLYGSSKLRNNIIPGVFSKNGDPLTYRQALIDLGRQGREYREDHWVRVFDHRLKSMSGVMGYATGIGELICNVVVVTDVRYRNEFEYLKDNGYYQIKILRDSDVIINDSSETSQEQIKTDEFDFVLDNNGSLEDLNENIKKIVSKIRNV